ncbi:MAG: hypothetical protein WC683_06000 [bacterium]
MTNAERIRKIRDDLANNATRIENIGLKRADTRTGEYTTLEGILNIERALWWLLKEVNPDA